MQLTHTAVVVAVALAAGCVNPDKRTLAELHRVEADMSEI